MLRQVRRWLPDREIAVVADSSYAVLGAAGDLPRAGGTRSRCVTRLRLDAALYAPAPPRQPGTKGRPRKKGVALAQLGGRPRRAHDGVDPSHGRALVQRRGAEVEVVTGTAVWYHAGEPVVPLRWVLIRDPQGKFAPQALLCTDRTREPGQILAWFVQRWQLEVTFEEARAHLGVETQRQWTDLAITRTTPALLGLFSLVTLLAHRQAARGRSPASGKQPGTSKRRPRSWMPWPPSGASCGSI